MQKINIKRKMIITIVFILLFFGSIITFYQYTLINNISNNEMKVFDKTIHNTFTVFLNELKTDLSKKTDIVINIPSVKIAFNNKNRKKLLNTVKPLYQRIIALSPHIKIMTFRLADGSTFLRVHKPDMFGDKLNKKRKIIIDTNHLKKQQTGFEVGKLKMTYRVVTPIFYKNRYLGLIEIGMEPEYLINKLKDLFKIKGALLVKRDALFHTSNHMEDTIISDFVFIRGDDLFKSHLKDINLKQNRCTTIMHKGKNYIINTDLELKNHKNEITAKILLSYNIDDHIKQLNSVMRDVVFHMLLLMITLLIVLNYFINYFMNKMNLLNEALALKSTELEIFNHTLVDNIKKEVEKNREKDKQLLHQSRLSQMGEMISMIAHQWRQPLAAISATSASIELKAGLNHLDNDVAIQKAQNISKFSQHLSKTIDDFREFFKPNKKKKETTYDEVILSILGIIEVSITNKNIQLLQELNCHETFSTYTNELKQVVLNLTKNAEDALLEKKIKDPTIKIVTYTKEDRYILEVSDNAGGIPEEVINKIFDPYFSTKKEKEGTGLGLYMSKMIIEEHCGGELSVVNSDEGAVFKITLIKEEKEANIL